MPVLNNKTLLIGGLNIRISLSFLDVVVLHGVWYNC